MPDEFDQLYAPETQKALSKLLVQLARNPKTGPKLRAVVKEFDPNYQLPAGDKVEELRAQIANDRQAEQIRAAQRAALEKQEAQKRGLIDGTLIRGRTYDDAAIKDIEALMTKYGLSDYEAGAKLYGADMKPAAQPGAPVTGPGATWTFPMYDNLFENPASAARDMAYKTISEMKAGR